MFGTDVSAPEIEAVLAGRRVKMRFGHAAMRHAELYWQKMCRGKLGYLGIVEQLTARTYAGLGAIAYGAVADAAMEEGKTPITMHDFDRMVTYAELRAAAQAMIDAVIESMPQGERKNVRRRPRTPETTIHGEASSGQDCVPASASEICGE
jgi:hypothetical protein